MRELSDAWLAGARTTYGLIRQESHGNNFLVDDVGQITLFDFDDCAYSWFSNDIAIVLFYIVMNADDWTAFNASSCHIFCGGYNVLMR